jgi:hypothetical protein
MYVRSADGGPEDAYEDIIPLNVWNWNLLEPKSRFGFRLYDGLHRFLHGPKLTAAMRLSILRRAASFEMMNDYASDG